MGKNHIYRNFCHQNANDLTNDSTQKNKFGIKEMQTAHISSWFESKLQFCMENLLINKKTDAHILHILKVHFTFFYPPQLSRTFATIIKRNSKLITKSCFTHFSQPIHGSVKSRLFNLLLMRVILTMYHPQHQHYHHDHTIAAAVAANWVIFELNIN